MSLRSLLESFEAHAGPVDRTASNAAESLADISQARSKAFEAGYASGWEDAQKSDDAAQKRIAAEFERNVETLAFTYHEAVDMIRNEMRGFVDAIITNFLPPILPELTREHLRSALSECGEQRLSMPIQIVASSNSHKLVETMLFQDFDLDLNLVEEPTLAPNQVFVRLGTRETLIDLAPLVDTLRSQLAALGGIADDKQDCHARA